MKTLKLYTLLLIALGLFGSCTQEEISNNESNSSKSLNRASSPDLIYNDHIKQCNKFGPTIKLNFSWTAGSNFSTTIFVDVKDLNGNPIGTWSKYVSNTFDDFQMTIGYPPSGLKDCSLLLPKTKYVFHVWKYSGIPATHYQLLPDFVEKTSFCFCTE